MKPLPSLVAILTVIVLSLVWLLERQNEQRKVDFFQTADKILHLAIETQKNTLYREIQSAIANEKLSDLVITNIVTTGPGGGEESSTAATEEGRFVIDFNRALTKDETTKISKFFDWLTLNPVLENGNNLTSASGYWSSSLKALHYDAQSKELQIDYRFACIDPKYSR